MCEVSPMQENTSLDLEFELPFENSLPFLQNDKLFKSWFNESIHEYIPSRYIPNTIKTSGEYIVYMMKNVKDNKAVKLTARCPNCSSRDRNVTLAQETASHDSQTLFCAYCKHRYMKIDNKGVAYIAPVDLTNAQIHSINIKDLIKLRYEDATRLMRIFPASENLKKYAYKLIYPSYLEYRYLTSIYSVLEYDKFGYRRILRDEAFIEILRYIYIQNRGSDIVRMLSLSIAAQNKLVEEIRSDLKIIESQALEIKDVLTKSIVDKWYFE